MATSRLASNAARQAGRAQRAFLAQGVAAARSTAGLAIDAARESARINSYPDPGSILSAVDAGATATINIDAHTRVYPVQGSVDVADVAIDAGAITGLAFSTKYWLYYDDLTLADTSPLFLATTDSATAQVGAAPGRHLLGFITTPADGAADTDGTGGGTPGGGGGGGGGQGWIP